MAKRRTSVNLKMGGGGLLRTTVLYGSGSYPRPVDASRIFVVVIGGGGAGGACGAAASTEYGVTGGGGAGGCAQSWYDVKNLPASISYVVGKGGTPGFGASGSQGNPGTDSIFHTMTAKCGKGGYQTAAIANTKSGIFKGGEGGVALNGNFANLTGESGHPGVFTPNGMMSGRGGESYMAIGGAPVVNETGTANNKGTPGDIGSGGSGVVVMPGNSMGSGSKGGEGIIIVYEYS